MRLALTLPLLVLGLLGGGCGGSGSGSSGPPKGTGTFAVGPTVDLQADIQPRGVVLGQFQTGAPLDLAVASIFGLVPLRTGVGDGSFAMPSPNTLPAIFSREAVVADFDQDGDDDLAATSDTNGIHVFLGDGQGGFTEAAGSPYNPGPSPFALAKGHVNADPFWDLVTGNTGDGTVGVLLGAGNGTFASAGAFAAGSTTRGVAVADFDWDGRDDVVASSAAGTFFLASNANGTLQAAVSVLGPPANVGGVAAGDLDGDGHPDVVVIDRGASVAEVRLSTGGGAFAAPATATFATGAEPHPAVLADLDGDGRLDLLVGCMTGHEVSVRRGVGDGTFTPLPALAVGGSVLGVAVGDLDGDGVPDVVAGVDLAPGPNDLAAVFLGVATP